MFANNEWQLMAVPFLDDECRFICKQVTLIWPDMHKETMVSIKGMNHLAPNCKMVVPSYLQEGGFDIWDEDGLFYFKNKDNRSTKGCIIEAIFFKLEEPDDLRHSYWYIPDDDYPYEIETSIEEDRTIKELIDSGKFLTIAEYKALCELGGLEGG